MNVTQVVSKYLVPKPSDEQRNAAIDGGRVPHADFRKHYGLNLMVSLSSVMATRRWGRFPEEPFQLVSEFVPHVCAEDRELLNRYFAQQPERVGQWIQILAERYPTFLHDLFSSGPYQLEAMLTLTLWQWSEALAPCAGSFNKVLEVLRLLREVDELQVWHLFRQRSD